MQAAKAKATVTIKRYGGILSDFKDSFRKCQGGKNKDIHTHKAAHLTLKNPYIDARGCHHQRKELKKVYMQDEERERRIEVQKKDACFVHEYLLYLLQ